MNSRNRKFAVVRKGLVLTSLALFACLVLFGGHASAQEPAQEAGARAVDKRAVGNPTRENLPNGGYRLVYRNAEKERIREEEHNALGVMTKRKEIIAVHPNGREASVRITSYGTRGQAVGVPVEEEEIKYDDIGRVERRVTYTDYDANDVPRTRTTTSGGRTRREIYDPDTQEYEGVYTPHPGAPAPASPPVTTPSVPPTAPATPPATTPAPSTAPPPSAEGEGTAEGMMVNYTPYEFYLGFSHNRVDGGDEREGFNGFATSFTGNVNRYVGLKGYYSYHTKSFEENGFDFSPRASIHQIFVGGEIKDNAREGSRFLPFVHGMAGVAHHRFSFDDGVGSFSDSRTGFAGVAGGGIDFRLNDRVDLRAQFDYNPNRIDGEWQHNVRAGFGLVFKFGRKSDDDVDDDTDSQDPSVSAVPQDQDAKKCEWKRKNLGKDTNVTQVRSDRPTIVEVRTANLSGSGGFEYHCLVNRGTALITYKYTDVDGKEKEEKLRVFCN